MSPFDVVVGASYSFVGAAGYGTFMLGALYLNAEPSDITETSKVAIGLFLSGICMSAWLAWKAAVISMQIKRLDEKIADNMRRIENLRARINEHHPKGS